VGVGEHGGARGRDGVRRVVGGDVVALLVDVEPHRRGGGRRRRRDVGLLPAGSCTSLASSGSGTVQMGAAAGGTAGGPLYALSTMLEDLPALMYKHTRGT